MSQLSQGQLSQGQLSQVKLGKVRFDVPKYEKKFDKTIEIDGKIIGVCSRLDEEGKEYTAKRVALAHLVMDEDTGVTFERYDYQQTEDIIILDTYTNIDIDWIETEEDKSNFLYFVYSQDIMTKVRPLCKDLDVVLNMAHSIIKASTAQFERKHSALNQFLNMLTGTGNEQGSFDAMLENPEVIEFMAKMSKNSKPQHAGKLETGIFNLSKKDID